MYGFTEDKIRSRVQVLRLKMKIQHKISYTDDDLEHRYRYEDDHMNNHSRSRQWNCDRNNDPWNHSSCYAWSVVAARQSQLLLGLQRSFVLRDAKSEEQEEIRRKQD